MKPKARYAYYTGEKDAYGNPLNSTIDDPLIGQKAYITPKTVICGSWHYNVEWEDPDVNSYIDLLERANERQHYFLNLSGEDAWRTANPLDIIKERLK